MFIDIPSDKLLPDIRKSVEEQLKHVMLPEMGYLKIEKIDWTEKGLRVWIQTEK